MVEAIQSDWRRAELSPRDGALCAYAELLVREPWSIEERHVEALRDAGLDDRAIHDAAQVIAYFSYINRVADGLGCDLEPEMPPRP